MKYRKSFYDHGCADEIADFVINYDLWYQLHDSPAGNEQVMYVGWDKYGDKLWEVGVELFSENEEDWAFHAQAATRFTRRRLDI